MFRIDRWTNEKDECAGANFIKLLREAGFKQKVMIYCGDTHSAKKKLITLGLADWNNIIVTDN